MEDLKLSNAWMKDLTLGESAAVGFMNLEIQGDEGEYASIDLNHGDLLRIRAKITEFIGDGDG